jgi:hypothetical protein
MPGSSSASVIDAASEIPFRSLSESVIDPDGQAQRALEDWRDQVTVTVPEAGQIVGVCRNTAYTAAKNGDIPTINLAGRIAVPVAALRRMLGEIA